MGRSRETWPRLRGTTPNESGRQTGPSGGVWLWVLRVRSGAALAGNEDGHDDDADADADAARSNDGARRRNRRGRSALISLRSAPIFPPRPSPLPLASTPLAPPLASPSFFPTFSSLPPSLSLALALSPTRLVSLSGRISPLPYRSYRKGPVCAAFHLLLPSGGYESLSRFAISPVKRFIETSDASSPCFLL